jgi:tetratricopeptide (TPR) repeat protein
MKKILIITITLCSLIAGAQNMQVQNMVNYLRNKDYPKAKAAADAAALHESTINSPKMWMYRGNVYKAIYDTSARDQIDKEAEEKALDAYVRCLKLDKDNIYKDDVKGNLVRAAAATKNKANFYRFNKEYDKALKCYELLESCLPFDFDGGIKRNNITKEKLMFEKFELYKQSANKEKTKEMAEQLIAIKYKDPKIFTDMIRLSLLDKDTTAALGYIEKGRAMFEDNMDLINSELDIYLARKKTDVLKDKLTAALEVSPDNEVLHLILANLYKGTNRFADAEKEYLKAIELRPDYEPAVFNLGVLYFTEGKEIDKKLGALPPKDPKIKEYESKSNEYFKKAIEYFEISYSATKDEKTKKVLKQLAARVGDAEKVEKYK